MRKIYSVFLAFLFVSGCLFYFLNLSPYMTDNYVFSRVIHPGYASFYSGAAITTEPMTVAGAVAQAKEMYFTWCGRFMGNLVVYLLFMLPPLAYALLASLVFGAYVLVLQVCIFGPQWRKKISAAWTLGLAGLIWLGMPSFGDAFLWLSVGGQIALLGQALILLPFRYALAGPPSPHKFIYVWGILLILGGICAASLDYATSAALPVTGICCLVWLYYKYRKIPLLPACATIGLCIGAALTLGAPGNAVRLLLTTHMAARQYLDAGWPERIINWLSHLPFAALMLYLPLLMLAWGCICLARKWGRCWIQHLPAAAFLFFAPACFTIGAYLFTPWPPARGFATVFAQLLICACIVLVAARQASPGNFVRLYRAAYAALGCICLITLITEAGHFYRLDKIVAERKSILMAADGGVVKLPSMPKNSGDRYWALGSSQNDISDDSDYYVNRAMAAWFGVSAVVPDSDDSGVYLPESPAEGLPRLELAKGRFIIRHGADSMGAPLYMYYYGDGSLLAKLPAALGESIYSWLAEDNGVLRNLLAALLLTRLEIESDGSERIDIFNPEKVWLLRPGASWRSFDLIPYVRR